MTEVRQKSDPDGRYEARDYVRVHVPTVQQYVGLEVKRDLVASGERVKLLVVPGVSKNGKLYYSVKARVDTAVLA